MHSLKQQEWGVNTATTQMTPFRMTQFIGKDANAVQGAFSRGASRMTATFIITWPDLANFIAGTIGFSYKAINGGGGLARVLPLRHPQLSYLYCTDISSVEPLGFGRVNLQTIVTTADDGQSLGPWPNFDFCKVTLVFTTPQYNVAIPDGLIVSGDATKGEQSRFVDRRRSSTTEMLKRENGTFSFEAAAPAGWSNQKFPGAIGVPVSKVKHIWTWIDVPDVGLFTGAGSDAGGIEQKLLNSVGTVNNATFMGYLAGTLLFENYEITPRTLPVAGTALNLPATAYPRSWDVRLYFTWFDPPAARIGSPTGHGHNLFPCPSDGKWYQIFDGAGNGKYLSTNFGQIFTMN